MGEINIKYSDIKKSVNDVRKLTKEIDYKEQKSSQYNFSWCGYRTNSQVLKNYLEVDQKIDVFSKKYVRFSDAVCTTLENVAQAFCDIDNKIKF